MQSGWFFQIPRPVPAPATPRDKEAGSETPGLGRGQERHPRTRELSASQAAPSSPGRNCHQPPWSPASGRTASYRETRAASLRLLSPLPGVSAPTGKVWPLGSLDKRPQEGTDFFLRLQGCGHFLSLDEYARPHTWRQASNISHGIQLPRIDRFETENSRELHRPHFSKMST